MTNNQCVVIIGDQADTNTCYGPFPSRVAAFQWIDNEGISLSLVSTYDITRPEDRPRKSDTELLAELYSGVLDCEDHAAVQDQDSFWIAGNVTTSLMKQIKARLGPTVADLPSIKATQAWYADAHWATVANPAQAKGGEGKS